MSYYSDFLKNLREQKNRIWIDVNTEWRDKENEDYKLENQEYIKELQKKTKRLLNFKSKFV